MSFPKQKTALVTGCSEIDHLGPCMALELNRRGWRVYATTRRAGESETSRKLRAEGCEVSCLLLVFEIFADGAGYGITLG